MNGTEVTERTHRKLKFLIVDDEPSVCDCIRLLLTYDGHEVLAVNDAAAALSAFEKDKFDLIFTDYSMPGTKGDELARAIKTMAPHQPILMITGLAPIAEKLASVDYVLSKPFMLNDLRDAINRILPEASFAE